MCSCGADSIEEMIRNVNIRWNEHESGTDKNLECFKHLKENFSLQFHWSLLSIASKNTFKQKMFEVYFITIMEPSLNSQMNSDMLKLFRNGIT